MGLKSLKNNPKNNWNLFQEFNQKVDNAKFTESLKNFFHVILCHKVLAANLAIYRTNTKSDSKNIKLHNNDHALSDLART